MSRKLLATTIGALVVAAGLAVVPSTSPAQAGSVGVSTAPGTFRAAPVVWQRCKDRDLRQAKAQCGYLVVPLDYANPTGPTIQLAVSRILHTKGPFRGAAFANPGGPGASALQYSQLSGAIPHGVGKTYDWYGMDPRGVGASIPALSCDPKFSNSQHRPHQPTTTAILSYWLAKTEAYAAACGTSAAKDLLPHLKTTDNVADFESLRTAIGQSQVTYYGFSYGTYIGQVWATLHPSSLKAMVFDGVVNPGRVWYQANLDQDHAFGVVFKKFFKWIGKYDRTFHLGRSGQQVGKRIAKLHKQLARKPARGKLGAGELEDVLTTAGYTNQAWPRHRRRPRRAGQPGQRRLPDPAGQAREGTEGGQRLRDVPRDLVHRRAVAEGLERLGGRQRRCRQGLAVPRLGERLVQRALPHLAGRQQRRAVRRERRRVHGTGPAARTRRTTPPRRSRAPSRSGRCSRPRA